MTSRVKESIFKLARSAKLFSLARRLTARKLRILCYHGVWLGPGHWGDFLFISPARFAERLECIQSRGFNVLSLADAISALDADTLPEDTVVITIDDGWYGSYKHMFPSLREAGMPFTVYAYTQPMLQGTPVFDVMVQYVLRHAKPRILELADVFEECEERYELGEEASLTQAMSRVAELLKRRAASNNWKSALSRLAVVLDVDVEPLLEDRVFELMTPEELSRIPSFGGTVELHTHTHELVFDRPEQVRGTIEDNRLHLKRILGGEYEHFCYPGGRYRPEIYPNLTSLGIRTATITDAGFVDRSTHRLAMPRICDGEYTSQAAFEAELSGALEIKRRWL